MLATLSFGRFGRRGKSSKTRKNPTFCEEKVVENPTFVDRRSLFIVSQNGTNFRERPARLRRKKFPLIFQVWSEGRSRAAFSNFLQRKLIRKEHVPHVSRLSWLLNSLSFEVAESNGLENIVLCTAALSFEL